MTLYIIDGVTATQMIVEYSLQIRCNRTDYICQLVY